MIKKSIGILSLMMVGAAVTLVQAEPALSKPIKVPTKPNILFILYDLLPTFADFAGVASPETDGLSLVPTLLGEPDNQEEHAYLYWENGGMSRHAQSVRMNHWWAYREHPSKPIALYDITKDVECVNDLANTHPEVVERIKAIFSEAHTDSEWNVNPGESQESMDAKKERAKKERAMRIKHGRKKSGRCE